MMRSDEHNRHMHGSYAEETATSSKVNVTDENESNEITLQETLSENQSMDISEPECNIVHKTLSQNNSSDAHGVPQERRRTVNPLRGKTEFLANETSKVNPQRGKTRRNPREGISVDCE